MESMLRYGENPNQFAAVYGYTASNMPALTNIRLAKSGKGGLSATNLMDIARGMDLLKFFPAPSVTVMKHLIPSGFATEFEGNSLAEIYVNAREADRRSALGSVVVMNRPLDKATARQIARVYVEVVAAPDYEEGTIGILEKGKYLTDVRIAQFSNLDMLPKFIGDDTKGLYDLKALPTGRVIVQAPYLTSIRGVDDLILDAQATYTSRKTGISRQFTVERDPTSAELRDLFIAWYINICVRSNGIVIVKDGVTLAVGSGQQERVGAVEQAIVKAYQKAMDREHIPYDPLKGITGSEMLSANPLEGAVASSDAFFPTRDSIDRLAETGVSVIIQPGGSKKDYLIIKAVNQHHMAMAVTGERCFAHI